LAYDDNIEGRFFIPEILSKGNQVGLKVKD
jgi:hypothetical protein